MKAIAKWITAPVAAGDSVVEFQTSFTAKKKIVRVKAEATAIGIYTLSVNGTKAGRGVLNPGWTSYHHRVQVQSYDLTELFTEGKNEISLKLGAGWAMSMMGYTAAKKHFDKTSVAASFEIEYEDGKKVLLGTDRKWDAFTTQILKSQIYMGETVDLTAGTKKLGKAVECKVATRRIPQVGELITEQERLSPVASFTAPNGERIIDFGQNMTGYVEVKIQAPAGSRIVFDGAEVLDKDGNFYNANYRKATNLMTYVTDGKENVFKPQFSFQGFRYIRLIEYPFEKVDPAQFTAIAVNSEMKRTGSYVCGNEKINQLYHNIIWGQKSNYLDIPTDCPQRDERLGWTGDAQVFCRTASINFDVEKFFKKWLGDVSLEQHPDGAVAGVVPDFDVNGVTRISAAWGDVACIAPWQMYLTYGNKKMLRDNFPLMKRWVEYMHGTGEEEFLWLGGFHYGDWLATDAGGEECVGATSTDLIASAFFAYSTSLVVKAGKVIGEDVSEYEKLYTNVRNKFRSYFMENGMPKKQILATEITPETKKRSDVYHRGDTQTALVLILRFGLCEESEKAALVARLAEMIRENGNKMSTGFVGTPYILHVLSENGYTDLAYTLLLQNEYPSWLYSVEHGATTMWEHWNSLREDGSFWSTSMNSFNHYAYGAVFDWIFCVSSGIQVTEEGAGYTGIKLQPHPAKALGFANASIESRMGKIVSNWYYKGEKVYYEFEIPEGVNAEVILPNGLRKTLGGGSYRFAD